MYRPLTGYLLSLLVAFPTMAAAQAVDPLQQANHEAQLAALDYLQDIYKTEEAVLYPDNNIIVVYVSQPYGAGVPFILYDAKLVIDDKDVTTHSYSGTELDKLMNDGVQVFTITHLDPGRHQLKATHTGNLGLVAYSASTSGPKRKVFSFTKGRSPYYLHLTITGSSRDFHKKGWE